MRTMETVEQENNSECEKQLTGADQFDLALVQEMASLQFRAVCHVPIFKWQLMDLMPSLINACESPFFPVIGNRHIGQLSLSCSKYFEWTLTLTSDDLGGKDEEESSDRNSWYFTGLDDHFIEQIMVFGSAAGKSKASICWHLDPGHLRTIRFELYRVSVAIPNFFLPSNNHSSMIVGQCGLLLETKSEDIRIWTVEEHTSFYFGSGDVRMRVSFLNSRATFMENRLGVTAILHIVKESGLAPFLLTFTVFSEKANELDSVNRMVIRREDKEFDQAMFLAFYEDLKERMERGHFHYKVVLEPLRKD